MFPVSQRLNNTVLNQKPLFPPPSHSPPFSPLLLLGKPQLSSARKPTIHLPTPTVKPAYFTLRIAALPLLTPVRKADGILVDIASSGDEHQGELAVDVDALAAGSVVVGDHADLLAVGVLELDGEAVVVGAGTVV